MIRMLPVRIVFLLVAVTVFLMMCAFQVQFTETVVVTQFDKIRDVFTPNDAGLKFKWPWPIERVHRYDTRLRSFDTEFRQLGTEDQKTVVLTAYSTWRIDDGEKFLKTIGREDAAAQKIRDLLENRVSTVLRSHPLAELVSVDPEEMKYATIEQEFLDGIRGPAEANYGIEIVSCGIQRLGIPESVTKDVFARMKEDRQSTIKQLKAEGQSKAQEIRAAAEEVSNKILARADAYAKKIVSEGDAMAARYYEKFAEEQELSSFLKMIESLLKILESGNTTMVLDAAEIQPFTILRDAATSPRSDSARRPSEQDATRDKLGSLIDENEMRPRD